MRYFRALVLMMSAMVPLVAGAFEKPAYPRLGVYWLGNAKYQDPAIQRQLARSDVVIIGIWDGWEQATGTRFETVIRNIKAINPDSLVFNYILNESIPANQVASRELVEKVDAMRWWLYPAGTSGTPVPSSWGRGYITVNNTLHGSADVNGDRWVDWYAKWSHRKFAIPNPSLDGFFLDNVFYKPRVDGDWNRDGSTDRSSDPVVASWQRQGLARHFDVMRQLMPGKIQMGNIAEWGRPDISLSEFAGKVQGGIMEAMIGLSWSVESWGTWAEMMAHYRKTMSFMAEPKLVLFHHIGSPTDYRTFRYGLASCLMDDGYFAFNSSEAYTDSPMFDEYEVDLGSATQPPPTAAWQNGVWRRDFANGIVLVNPKGNGARAVQLESEFQRIAGVQDPAVNNGSTTRSVTLQDRDGIILLRVGNGKPQPPTDFSIE